MRPIKSFEDFLKDGTVRKQSSDFSRSSFLLSESEKQHIFLKKIIKNFGVNEESANVVIKLSYDIIMGKIRSAMLFQGFNSSGFGAHEAEVSFLRVLKIAESKVQFLDQLRYSRNGIMYYGKVMDSDYASRVLVFLNDILKDLK